MKLTSFDAIVTALDRAGVRYLADLIALIQLWNYEGMKSAFRVATGSAQGEIAGFLLTRVDRNLAAS